MIEHALKKKQTNSNIIFLKEISDSKICKAFIVVISVPPAPPPFLKLLLKGRFSDWKSVQDLGGNITTVF